MYAVIFQLTPRPGRAREYFAIAAALRAELETIDGFISVERFESVSRPGAFVSLSFWRDEEAILAWRRHAGHQHAQALGRADIFADYRLSVAAVVRDYGKDERTEAPAPVAPGWGNDFSI